MVGIELPQKQTTCSSLPLRQGARRKGFNIHRAPVAPKSNCRLEHRTSLTTRPCRPLPVRGVRASDVGFESVLLSLATTQRGVGPVHQSTTTRLVKDTRQAGNQNGQKQSQVQRVCSQTRDVDVPRVALPINVANLCLADSRVAKMGLSKTQSMEHFSVP